MHRPEPHSNLDLVYERRVKIHTGLIAEDSDMRSPLFGITEDPALTWRKQQRLDLFD